MIQAYQSFQYQFQRESSVLAKRSKEGLTSKSTKQFYFVHVLETLRSLRDYYFESAGLIKERVIILQFDFKTPKTTGPTKIDLSDDKDLIYFLRLYLQIRISLLLGKDHDFCLRDTTSTDDRSSFQH